MIIVYNPPTGAKIKGFNFQGTVIEEHPVKGVGSYEEAMANALVATYPFLKVITEAEAQSLKLQEEEVDKEGVYVAKKDRTVKEVEVPIAKVTKVATGEEDKSTEIPDDLKGTDWYGGGVKEEKGSD